MHALFTLLILTLFPSMSQAGLEGSFLYHPRHYSTKRLNTVPGNVVQIAYSTSSGNQVAWYVPPAKSASTPQSVWLLFAGNASVALDWISLADGSTPDPAAGYLLIDYPGYGLCDGKPSEKTIAVSSSEAVVALARYLNVDCKDLRKKVSVMGHSLGAAVAIQYAAKYGVERMVLLAPFTSLDDMARNAAGFMGAFLVKNGFNNRLRLAAIASSDKPPRVMIFHGSADEVIPVRMGRELAGVCGDRCTFIEVDDADHTSVLLKAKNQVWDFMAK